MFVNTFFEKKFQGIFGIFCVRVFALFDKKSPSKKKGLFVFYFVARLLFLATYAIFSANLALL